MMIEFAVIWAHGIHAQEKRYPVRGQYFGAF